MIRMLEDYMEEYNLSNPSTLNLVFFIDAVEHITRIARVLRQPRGNALLVGVGGSGKSMPKDKVVHRSARTCDVPLHNGTDLTSGILEVSQPWQALFG
jgi:dynein heavy chain, axonemal